MANEMLNVSGKHTGNGIKYEADTEVFTGDYWIDGKPIYAYVFTNQNYRTNGTEFTNTLNVDKPIECLLLNGRNNNSKYTYVQKTAVPGSASINTNNNNIIIDKPSGYSDYSWESILLKYTKTTD